MIVLMSVLFGLLSMVAFAISNATSKPLSQKYGPSQTLFLRGFIVVAIFLLAAIPTYHNLQDWPMVLGGFLLGVAGYLPVLAFLHALKESPIGVVAPISGTAPLFTVILAVLFLHVELSTWQWVAVVMVIAANVAVSVNVRNWRQSNLFQRSSGVPYALAAAVGWGIFFFLLVPVTKRLGPGLAGLVGEVGVMAGAGLHLMLTSQRVVVKDALSPAVLVNGALICVGTLAFVIGVRYFNVGIVAALSNSTALVAVLIGMRHFGERLDVKQKVTAVLMIVGIAMISFL